MTNKANKNIKGNYYQRAKNAEIARAQEIVRLNGIDYAVPPTEGIDSGAYGKMIELKHSRGLKKTVAGHDKPDTSVKFKTPNGGYIYKEAEVKTNGGRMDGFIGGDAEFIIYGLNVKNASTKTRRFVPELIFTRQEFLDYVEAHNLMRHDLAKAGEPLASAMKPTSKVLYNWLLQVLAEQPERVYDKTKDYNWLLG